MFNSSTPVHNTEYHDYRIRGWTTPAVFWNRTSTPYSHIALQISRGLLL